MEKRIYIVEYWAKKYSHNGCQEHDTEVFTESRFAIDHVMNDVVKDRSYQLVGHWRDGGLNIKIKEAKEGQWERIEIFPLTPNKK